MSKAYKCDICGEYYSGDYNPVAEGHMNGKKVSIDLSATAYGNKIDVCGDCRRQFILKAFRGVKVEDVAKDIPAPAHTQVPPKKAL